MAHKTYVIKVTKLFQLKVILSNVSNIYSHFCQCSVDLSLKVLIFKNVKSSISNIDFSELFRMTF